MPDRNAKQLNLPPQVLLIEGSARVVQIGEVFAVEERAPCPCPDCEKPEHGEWKRRGGSMTYKGAVAIMRRDRAY